MDNVKLAEKITSEQSEMWGRVARLSDQICAEVGFCCGAGTLAAVLRGRFGGKLEDYYELAEQILRQNGFEC